ncbi:MAG: helix-turn-helix domain-containing protein [Hassallia sp.]
MVVKVKLKELREKHPNKPSQRDLGDLLEIAEGNYRRLENGHAKSISFDAVNKLCAFFNCTPNDILEYKHD